MEDKEKKLKCACEEENNEQVCECKCEDEKCTCEDGKCECGCEDGKCTCEDCECECGCEDGKCTCEDCKCECGCEDGKCTCEDCKCDCDCEDGKCTCEDCECECGCEDEKCTCEDGKCECEEEHVHDENCEHEHHDPRYEYIMSLEAELKAADEKLLRINAEIINYRKRMEEEQIRMFKYMDESIIKKILPIIDNFERAINMDDTNMKDEVSKFLVGFKMVKHDLIKVLSESDVTEIEALGKEFNPTYHEAIVMEKGSKSGIILEVLQKGYMLKDKVIRPALVKVSE